MEFFSSNSAFYLYSALLQANAAILSIVAIFVIFRIQSLASAVDAKRSALSQDFGVHISAHDIDLFDRISLEKKKEWIETETGEGRLAGLLPHFGAWLRYSEDIGKLKRHIVLPTVVIGGSIVFFAIELLLASYLHFKAPVVEALFMILSVIIEFLCILIVVRAIFVLLQIRAGDCGISGDSRFCKSLRKILGVPK
jgi:hypothetical protein